MFVFVLISSIIPSVFADSYVTITQTSGQTTNPVAIQNSAGTNLFIIDTSGNQNFLSTNVAKFSNCGIVERNVASTFATTICGGAVTANRTLNTPIITGTDTFATLGLGQTFTNLQGFSGGIAIASGQKINVDGVNGAGGTYLIQSSANTMDIFTGTTDTVSFSANKIALAAGEILSNAGFTSTGNSNEVGYQSSNTGAGGKIYDFGSSGAGSGLGQGLYFVYDQSDSKTILTASNTILSLGSIDFSIPSAKKIFLDGGTNVYFTNPSSNVLTETVGGTQILNSTNTTFQFKLYSAATDPTTSTLASGYCTIAKNTGTGISKVFCNDGGTMKTVALS